MIFVVDASGAVEFLLRTALGMRVESLMAEADLVAPDWGVERLAHRPLLPEAWSLRGHVTAYDALYVAAARIRDAALITADGPLSRAPGLGVAVHNVRLS